MENESGSSLARGADDDDNGIDDAADADICIAFDGWLMFPDCTTQSISADDGRWQMADGRWQMVGRVES